MSVKRGQLQLQLQLQYNNAPVANDDDLSVDEDAILSFTLQDVLGNDTDLDGDNLIPTLVTNPSNGILAQQPDGSFSYTPNTNFHGTDSFTYRVNDGTEDSNIATVNILVNPVNDIPLAGNDTKDVDEDSTVTVSFDDLLANDIDVDGNAKTIIAIDTNGTAGGVTLNTQNRTITYSADADKFDLLVSGDTTVDSFKYTLQGSSGETAIATVTISVRGINDGINLLGTVKADKLSGTSGEDRIKGDNGNDTIDGGEGADNVFGDNGDDILNGGNSIDNLFGGNGNDNLNGGNGNDWLAGERGNDSLTGGLGNDVFLFAQGGGIDTITNGIDKIQIAADTGITAFGQLKITGGTVNGVSYSTITMGNGGQVTLTGVSTTQLDATDFIFPV